MDKHLKEISRQLEDNIQVLKSLVAEMDSEVKGSPSGQGKDKFEKLVAFLGLGQDSSDDTLLHSVLNCAMHVVKAGGAGLTFYDQAKQRLVFRAAVGDGAEGIVGYEVPLEGSQHGLAFATGEIQASTPIHKVIEDQSEVVFRNVLVAPLIVQEETIGTISAVNKVGKDNFSRDDLDAYHHFANLAAQVLNRQLKEEIVQSMIAGQPAKEAGDPESSVFETDQSLLIQLLRNTMLIGRERPELLESCLCFTETLLGKENRTHAKP